MTVKEMIRKKEENGYSLKKISEYSGVPVVTLQKIFAGKTEHPRRNTLNAIEKVFLLNGENYGEAESTIRREETMPYRILRTENTSGKRQGEYTLEDYRQLSSYEGKELIDGVFYEMYRPDVIHQQMIGYIHMCLCQYTFKKNGYYTLQAPIAVCLGEDQRTLVKPDLIAFSGSEKIYMGEVHGAPDFVLEVLSRETRKKDMTVKLNKYMDAGVREYWILDPDQKKLVVYNFTEEDFLPCIYALNGNVSVTALGGEVEIDLGPIAETLEK